MNRNREDLILYGHRKLNIFIMKNLYATVMNLTTNILLELPFWFYTDNSCNNFIFRVNDLMSRSTVSLAVLTFSYQLYTANTNTQNCILMFKMQMHS